MNLNYAVECRVNVFHIGTMLSVKWIAYHKEIVIVSLLSDVGYV